MIEGSQNLHSHTWNSDGKMTHRETLDIAAGSGCTVVAFTDHDSLITPEQMNELESLRGHATKWISGIELSTKEGTHIIGLFVDPTNLELIAHSQKIKQARIDKARSTSEQLSGLGFSITAEEVLAKASEGVVAKPHIVEVLVSKEENIPLLKSYIAKFEEASKSDPVVAEDYSDARDSSARLGIGAFVYPLFLRRKPFVPGLQSSYDSTPSFDEAVRMIRSAGGLVFLAHWHTEKRTLTLAKVEEILIAKRLDGVETKLGWKETEKVIDKEKQEQYDELARVVDRTGALHSVSLDAHFPSDYEVLTRDQAFAFQTVGTIEKIIERSGVSTKWSSLA